MKKARSIHDDTRLSLRVSVGCSFPSPSSPMGAVFSFELPLCGLSFSALLLTAFPFVAVVMLYVVSLSLSLEALFPKPKSNEKNVPTTSPPRFLLSLSFFLPFPDAG